MSDRLALAIQELVEALRESLREEAASVPRAPDRLLSIDEAAAALGIGRSALYGEFQAGRLTSVKVGRRRLVPASAIADYVSAIHPGDVVAGPRVSGRPGGSPRSAGAVARAHQPAVGLTR